MAHPHLVSGSAKGKEAFDFVIRSGQSERHYWRDLWRFRELFYFLAWRDIIVRYKQTVIGIVWALARPLFTMMVFTVVFSKLAKLPSEGVPYPILVFAGLLPWQFFSMAFSGAGDSLVNNSGMISKVYFPRLIVPTSAVIVAFADFLISLALLAALMAWYGFLPSPRIFALPLLMVLAFMVSIGAGVWVASLNVKYRDFKIIIPFVVQIGLYISPVGFSSSIVPEQWRLLYAFNPMVGVIDGFRWCILGNGELPVLSILISLLLSALMIATGVAYFRATEKTFADMI
jgi:lipopolysaccharide transport system permease protein